ncbi:MAG: hypothetical protein IH994_10955 [Proteobacteria bacterium]|nr:hypothetical protein [Pseudomonadota bacterium]
MRPNLAARDALREDRWLIVLFLAPTTVFMVLLLWYPFLQGVWMSLFRWPFMGEPQWRGLQNYTDFIGADYFWLALKSTFIYSLSTVFQLAMALTAANTVLMLEHAIYSVISPEGCASILWRDGDKAEDAAEALKLTAEDLLKLGVIDRIIAEPLGGAHRDKQAAITAVGGAIEDALGDLAGIDGGVLKARRREKYLEMGAKGLS